MKKSDMKRQMKCDQRYKSAMKSVKGEKRVRALIRKGLATK